MKTILAVLTGYIGGFTLLSAQNMPPQMLSNWLLKSYADAVLSASAATRVSADPGFIHQINLCETMGDTAYICFYGSEGAKFPLTAHPNGYHFSMEGTKNDYILSLHKTEQGYTILRCVGPDNYSADFIAVAGDPTDFRAATDLLNNKLFAGGYSKTIENNMRTRDIGVSVKFNDDGSISGIKEYDRYEILPASAEFGELNIMKLYKSDDIAFVWKAWDYQNGRFTVYDLIENPDGFTYSKGDVFLELDKRAGEK